jgi:hypothetical protein
MAPSPFCNPQALPSSILTALINDLSAFRTAAIVLDDYHVIENQVSMMRLPISSNIAAPYAPGPHDTD